MPLDYATVKDWRFDEVRQRYDEKDAMLYALGIGLGQDPEDERQLRYVYERDLLAFPTMSVVLGYPGFWVRDPRTGIDWIKVVHGEQRLAMHAPLPASGVIIGRSRNTHVVDKGADKGALVITERTLHDEAGACLATLTQTTFCRGDGGFGGGDDGPALCPPRRKACRTSAANCASRRRRRCSTGSTRTAIRCTPIPRWRGVRVIRAQSCTGSALTASPRTPSSAPAAATTPRAWPA